MRTCGRPQRMWQAASLQDGGTMSSAIDAIGAGSYVTATAAAAGQSTSPSRADQLMALNELLYRYQVGLSRGDTADTLGSLAQQIAAAEKALGQYPSLLKPPARSAREPPRNRAAPRTTTETRHALDGIV